MAVFCLLESLGADFTLENSHNENCLDLLETQNGRKNAADFYTQFKPKYDCHAKSMEQLASQELEPPRPELRLVRQAQIHALSQIFDTLDKADVTGKVVLDVGSGSGTTYTGITTSAMLDQIHSLELSEPNAHLFKYLSTNFLGVPKHQKRIQDFVRDGRTFPVVIANNVITAQNNYQAMQGAIQCLYRIVQPGGIAVLTLSSRPVFQIECDQIARKMQALPGHFPVFCYSDELALGYRLVPKDLHLKLSRQFVRCFPKSLGNDEPSCSLKEAKQLAIAIRSEGKVDDLDRLKTYPFQHIVDDFWSSVITLAKDVGFSISDSKIRGDEALVDGDAIDGNNRFKLDHQLSILAKADSTIPSGKTCVEMPVRYVVLRRPI